MAADDERRGISKETALFANLRAAWTGSYCGVSMTEEREAGLLERLIAGDPAAFRDLVEAYKKKMYGLAYQITKNHADAQDVSQAAFIRAFRSVKSLKPGGSLNGWLYRIVYNTALDHVRKKPFFPREAAIEAAAAYGSSASEQTARGTIKSSSVPDSEPPDHSPGPERQAEIAGLRRKIRQALAQISERERTVFVLRHYHGLKIKEIADSLDITIGSTKSYLFRSIRKLRKELASARLSLGTGDRP
jgi:RNA polymerase sigma-70 factor (ECF subfamily)